MNTPLRNAVPHVACLSCLAALVAVLGCGGGGSKGGGSAPADNPIIVSNVQTVGVAGGTLPNDDGTVSLVVPAGTVAEGTVVSLQERQTPIAGITPSSATGLPHSVELEIDPAAMVDGSTVQVVVPQLQTYDQLGTAVFAFTSTDRPVPLDTSLDATTGRVVATLPKATILALESGTRAKARSLSLPINIAVSAFGTLGVDVPADGQLYFYKPQTSAVRGDWEKADGHTMPNGRIAVLVHGIMNDVDDMKDTARFLAGLTDAKGNKIYTEVWGYGYRWWAHIAKSGDRFASDLKGKMVSGAQVDLYGHSMGGLVCRWAFERPASATASTSS